MDTLVKCASDASTRSGSLSLLVPEFGYAVGALRFSCDPVIVDVTPEYVISSGGGAFVSVRGYRLDELPSPLFVWVHSMPYNADLNAVDGGMLKHVCRVYNASATLITCRAPRIDGAVVVRAESAVSRRDPLWVPGWSRHLPWADPLFDVRLGLSVDGATCVSSGSSTCAHPIMDGDMGCTCALRYAFASTPQLLSLSPTAGGGGTAINITGTGLLVGDDPPEVYVGDQFCEV